MTLHVVYNLNINVRVASVYIHSRALSRSADFIANALVTSFANSILIYFLNHILKEPPITFRTCLLCGVHTRPYSEYPCLYKAPADAARGC